MPKKIKYPLRDDLKGFEELIEYIQPSSFMGVRGDKNTKNLGGDHLSFLIHDHQRLEKITELIGEKIPLLESHDQGLSIIQDQQLKNEQLKRQLFDIFDNAGSTFHRSFNHLWNQFFYPDKT